MTNARQQTAEQNLNETTIQRDGSSNLKPPVDSFVQSVAGRLNRHRLWNTLLRSSVLAGAVMLAIALVYVWPGYSVPPVWYAVVFGAAVVGVCIATVIGRTSTENAAHFADTFFELKDSVRSCVNFAGEGRSGGFYDLQSRQTTKLVQKTHVNKIPFEPAYRIGILGALLLLISIALGFKGPSPEMLANQQLKTATSQMTLAANEELKELVEELENAIEDEQERKLVDPDKLRKWVNELKETTDHKDALRQYARLELKLNRASEALRQRQDEKLLDTVADALNKEEMSKKLGEKLKQKKYELAAKDLKKMEPEKLDPKNLKELSEKRKELAKLKAIANRMAAAARSTRGANNRNNGNSKNSRQGQPSDAKIANAKHGQSATGQEMEGEPSDAQADPLAQMLEDLEDSVEMLDQELEELELADLDELDQDLEQCEDCENCEACAKAKLDELADKLMRMAKKRSARAKLKKLSQKCSECQSAGAMIVESQAKGGKKAGVGSVDSKRDEIDKFADNGQFSKLKGINGQGPSLTKVESAEDGSGTSNLRREAKKHDFKRQFESFVGREDVPEDLKTGVKNYFTNIHASSEESTGESSDNQSGSSADEQE